MVEVLASSEDQYAGRRGRGNAHNSLLIFRITAFVLCIFNCSNVHGCQEVWLYIDWILFNTVFKLR